MQNLVINKGNLPVSVDVPPSKSYANRALILASLKKGVVKISNMPEASDVTHLLNALSEVGLEISRNENTVSILNHFPQCEKESDLRIEVGEGGTTARFLASMLLLGKRQYTLILGQRLKLRPWSEFLNLASTLGAKVSLKDNLLVLQGPIKLLDQIEVDCTETTQFASGLQLAFAFTETKIIPQNMSTSYSYFEMTKLMIEGLKKNDEFFIPLDWSSASYPMCFAALKHKIIFPKLQYDHSQSDSKLYYILNELNCLKEIQEGIEVSPISASKSFDLDVSDCLDLVPALAFLLAHLKGDHVLRGVKNLAHKESHRLEEVIKLLGLFKREASSDGLCLSIKGDLLPLISSKDLIFPEDHRMVMAGALFLRFHQGGSVFPASAVTKSYPDFFSLFEKA